MRTFTLIAIASVLIGFTRPALATPEDDLTQGIVTFGRGDLDGALVKLDAAAAGTTDVGLLAQISRQRGIVLEAAGRRREAVVAFLRALYFDPAIQLPGREHRGDVAALFACAHAMSEAGVKESAVEARWPTTFDAPSWSCPVGAREAPTTATPAATPPPAATPAPTPAPAATPAATPPLTAPPVGPAEERSIWSSPVLWIVVGAVVVGGAVTTGVLLGTADSTYGGTTDTTFILSGED